MKSRRTCTQQNDSTSSVSLANRLYDEKRSTLTTPPVTVAKCCFGTRAERVGSSVNTTTSALQNTHRHQRWQTSSLLASNTCPTGLVSVPVRGRATARDQRLPQRREQRRQTPQAVGDGALGKIQPMRAQIRQQPVRGPVQQILVDQHRHPYRDAQDALRDQPGRRRRRDQPRCRRALTTAAIAPPLDHPPVGAHLDLQLLAVLTVVRVILVPACRAAAPLRINLVCFHLHRQVCVPAPAMARCSALLTTPPRPRRDRCLAAAAPAPRPLPRCRRRSWFASRCRAAAPTVPAAAGAVPSASHPPPPVRPSAAALALPPCHAFSGNSAPAGAVLLPRAAAPLSHAGTPPCSLAHSARTLPRLISITPFQMCPAPVHRIFTVGSFKKSE